MGIQYNLPPLYAMEVFYHGEKNGIWQGDFIKNEKKRNLVFPLLLREFLECYGYLHINQNENSFQIWHPDYMVEIQLETNDGYIPVLVIGTLQEVLVGICTNTQNLMVVFGDQTDEGVVGTPVDLEFSGILTIMIVAELLQSDSHEIFETDTQIASAFAKYGVDYTKLHPNKGYTKHYSLNFNDENNVFLIGVFADIDGKLESLHVIHRKILTLEELQQLFENEFYQNALHCDFNYALQLQKQIIQRLKDANPLELADHYKLAARCCWKLGALEEADSWYEKGRSIIEDNLENAPDQAQGYFRAMGNFYADTKQYDKSDQYYTKANQILQQYFSEDFAKIGAIYQSQAYYLVENGEDLDKAIELYNKALEAFQKDPKNCKYDIARTQQLRADAKKLNKSNMQKN